MNIDDLVGAVATRAQPIVAARPRLYTNWRQLMLKAWSFRLALLAAFLSGAEVICEVFVSNPPISPAQFAALAGLVSFAACIARLVAQKELGVSE